MGRPPLHNVTTHLNLPQDLLDRMDAIVGPKGRSKFVRQAVAQMLDRLAPVPATLGREMFEHDGGHHPRLSAAGTAALLEIIRKQGFDAVMQRLGYSDPAEFLYILLGHRELPDRVTSILVALLVNR